MRISKAFVADPQRDLDKKLFSSGIINKSIGNDSMCEQKPAKHKPLTDQEVFLDGLSKLSVGLEDLLSDIKAKNEASWIEFCKEQEGEEEKRRKICAEVEDDLNKFREQHPEFFKNLPRPDSKQHDS